MKIAIGTKVKKNQAWGGGNNFAINLGKYLKDKGFKVFYDLKCTDLDFIILTDPRKNSLSASFGPSEIKYYLKKINKNTIVVHRLNECDERKNTKNINKELLSANKIADYTVYISKWLKKTLIKSGFTNKFNSTILNGADRSIFRFSKNTWKKGKIKIVTHHWSNHPNKGAAVYKKLDELLNNTYWKKKFSFTYIGNQPQGVKFKNTRLIKPMFGKNLAKQLGKHHLYITGSLNEPGGNHQNEGAVVGLPILYLNSGCMNEYCNGYGVEYKNNNLEKKLNIIVRNYKRLRKNIKFYPYESKNTCDQYYKLFLRLDRKRKNIFLKRKKLDLTFKDYLNIGYKKFRSLK